MKNPEIINELQRLALEHGGIVQPEAVVDAARDEQNPLHSQFEWDDSIAAHQHRLWQARQLLARIVVTMDQKPAQQMFVSVTTDRREGGYRLLTDVMSSDELRAQLLLDAKGEMLRFKAKYHQLNELAKVFAAMDEVSTERELAHA